MTVKKAKPSRACLHCIHDVPKRKKLYPIPKLLEQLLVTINMFEGTDESHLEFIVNKLRDVHLDLKNQIGIHPDYQENEDLAKLDKVYKKAGWDNNGLRWTSEDGEFNDIFIVEFDDNKNTRWHLA